ncbi:MAG: hypothetical protein GX591_16535 [Planctomycetes bacterium]|nr:hypothetical protein [Planctomycetota bacterium]
MAPAPGREADRSGGRLGGLGRFLGFTIVAGMAFALLATVVVLPAWARLDQARADRDALAFQTAAYDRLVDYRTELIESVKTDPLQTERLLMEQRNYTRPGEAAYAIDDAPADPPVLDAIKAQLPAPRPASATLATLSRRVQRPATRRGLLLLSGLLLVLATVMFLPPGHRSAAGEE